MFPSAPFPVTIIETPISVAVGCYVDEGVVPYIYHCCSIAMHEWFGRDMKITDHIITLPSADELDGSILKPSILLKNHAHPHSFKIHSPEITDIEIHYAYYNYNNVPVNGVYLLVDRFL